MLQALWSVYTQVRSGVTDNIQAEVAANLHRMGIPAGSKVGFIGRSFDAYWAHLGRFRITCEIPESTFDNLTYTPPSTDADQFWAADQSTQRAALNTMAATGVACVLAKNAPAGAMRLGWKRIGLTNYYVIIPPVRTGTS